MLCSGRAKAAHSGGSALELSLFKATVEGQIGKLMQLWYHMQQIFDMSPAYPDWIGHTDVHMQIRVDAHVQKAQLSALQWL